MFAPLAEIDYTKDDIMTGLQILFIALAFVVGAGVGASGYRYMLKRDPDRLERLAKEAKQLGDKVKDRFS